MHIILGCSNNPDISLHRVGLHLPGPAEGAEQGRRQGRIQTWLRGKGGLRGYKIIHGLKGEGRGLGTLKRCRQGLIRLALERGDSRPAFEAFDGLKEIK